MNADGQLMPASGDDAPAAGSIAWLDYTERLKEPLRQPSRSEAIVVVQVRRLRAGEEVQRGWCVVVLDPVLPPQLLRLAAHFEKFVLTFPVRVDVTIGEKRSPIDSDRGQHIGEPSADIVFDERQALMIGVVPHPRCQSNDLAVQRRREAPAAASAG